MPEPDRHHDRRAEDVGEDRATGMNGQSRRGLARRRSQLTFRQDGSADGAGHDQREQDADDEHDDERRRPGDEREQGARTTGGRKRLTIRLGRRRCRGRSHDEARAVPAVAEQGGKRRDDQASRPTMTRDRTSRRGDRPHPVLGWGGVSGEELVERVVRVIRSPRTVMISRAR
jgi:hypothetical protein